LEVRLVDGTSLAAAVVVNSIPQGTDQVVLAGNISKVAHAIAAALCKKNVKVRSAKLHVNHLHIVKIVLICKTNTSCSGSNDKQAGLSFP